MRIVLLGPNGQLGTDIRSHNASKSRSWQIIPIDRQSADLSNIDAACGLLSGIDSDAVINCSSYHKTDDVEKNPALAFALNTHLVRRIADVCVEKKATFIHISTDYVFGGGLQRRPLVESDPKAPVNVYGASKAMGEDLALMTGANMVILRVASLFGVAGASGKGGNFVETILRLGREKGSLSIVNDQIMSPTATADVADVVWKMLISGIEPGIWHVVNSGQASWYEFALRILERAGVKATVSPISSMEFKTTALRPPYSVLDNSKVTAAIGPMRHWTEALESYLAAKNHCAAQNQAR